MPRKISLRSLDVFFLTFETRYRIRENFGCFLPFLRVIPRKRRLSSISRHDCYFCPTESMPMYFCCVFARTADNHAVIRVIGDRLVVAPTCYQSRNFEQVYI